MAQPEKLNLWDRFFNRYRKEIHKRGSVQFGTLYRYRDGSIVPGSESENEKSYVEYLIIDRVTGSETIQRVYLT